MAWFLNPFNVEFRGSLMIGDRQYLPNFICPAHRGRSDSTFVSEVDGPWDLSGNDADGNPNSIIKIYYEIKAPSLKSSQWDEISIDLTSQAENSSAVTAEECSIALRLDDSFKSLLWASRVENKLRINLTVSKENNRFFIMPGQADSVLKFNLKAGIAELPNIFKRDRVTLQMNSDEQSRFEGFSNSLLLLDPEASGGNNEVDNDYINNAFHYKKDKKFDASVTQEDYQLLRASAPFFSFTKQTVDGSDRITELIEYPCGAEPGLMVKKIIYRYTGGNNTPSEILELPYILEDSDLITP